MKNTKSFIILLIALCTGCILAAVHVLRSSPTPLLLFATAAACLAVIAVILTQARKARK